MDEKFGLLLKSGESDFSIVFNLLWIDNGVTCFFPCLNTSSEALHVLVTHGDDLSCLTGSRPFIRSASVEDDLLILYEGGKLGLELA
jgi:hypothetical protein